MLSCWLGEPHRAPYYCLSDADARVSWNHPEACLVGRRKEKEAPYYHAPVAACWDQSIYSDTMLSALAVLVIG